jgi:hypothetical protein
MFDKWRIFCPQAFCTREQPLASIVLLQHGPHPFCERISPKEALPHILANCFRVDFQSVLACEKEFQQLTELLSARVLYRMVLPRGFAELLCFVEDQMESIFS